MDCFYSLWRFLTDPRWRNAGECNLAPADDVIITVTAPTNQQPRLTLVTLHSHYSADARTRAHTEHTLNTQCLSFFFLSFLSFCFFLSFFCSFDLFSFVCSFVCSNSVLLFIPSLFFLSFSSFVPFFLFHFSFLFPSLFLVLLFFSPPAAFPLWSAQLVINWCL